MAIDNSLNPHNAAIARNLITEAKSAATAVGRMKLISSHFIGLPYIVNPLIGSLTVPEELVVRFDGFDCVTYVETVLALSLSRSVEEFPMKLRDLRYQNGQVEWQKRLHYTTDWAAYHIRRGFLRDMTAGDETVVVEKTLSFIEGLRPKTVMIRYYPKDRFPSVSRWLTDGDLLYFLSTRRDLDTFHIGLAFRDGDRLLIRHARHMRHRVLEQPLADFVRVVHSPGFIVNRLAKAFS